MREKNQNDSANMNSLRKWFSFSLCESRKGLSFDHFVLTTSKPKLLHQRHLLRLERPISCIQFTEIDPTGEISGIPGHG